MPTLYRQYRPQNFEEILGQNYIKTIIQNEILTNKIAHAYLFCGPRAVGKTTMARVLAKAVNCLQRKPNEFEPCNKCENCLNINTGRNLDIIEIDAASNTGVDNVRENVISSSRIGSNSNKYKVFIIDEVHMLSINAFNALLKVLEEPPLHVIFILCTTEIHKVPSTIISRCQRFDFKRISVVDMVKKLEKIVKMEGIKVEKGILEAVARQADGYLRDAESLLGQIISIGGDTITQEEADLVIPRSDFNEIVSLLEYLTKKDTVKAIQLVNNLIDNGLSLKNFVADLIQVVRKIMLAKVNPNLSESLGLNFGETLEMKINTLTDTLTLSQLVRYLEKFNQVNNELKNNFIIQLPLELAIIDLCLGEAPAVNQPLKTNMTPPSTPVQNSYTAPKSVPPAPNRTVAMNSDVSLEQILAKWSEVLVRVKPFNHSLSFVLQACVVSQLDGNKLLLTFKYKFHKDRVSSPEIKVGLENILLEVYGANLIIEALVDENLELQTVVPEKIETQASESLKPNNIINNILKTFGGEVVS
jgi:DNA polymerase-3 subunit gamma/tau